MFCFLFSYRLNQTWVLCHSSWIFVSYRLSFKKEERSIREENKKPERNHFFVFSFVVSFRSGRWDKKYLKRILNWHLRFARTFLVSLNWGIFMFVFWDSNVKFEIVTCFLPQKRKKRIPHLSSFRLTPCVAKLFHRPEIRFNFYRCLLPQVFMFWFCIFSRKKKHNWNAKNKKIYERVESIPSNWQISENRQCLITHKLQIGNSKHRKPVSDFQNTDRISIYLLSPLHCFCFFYLTKKTLNDIKVMWSFWKQNKTKRRKASYEEKEALKQREKLRKLTNFPNPPIEELESVHTDAR